MGVTRYDDLSENQAASSLREADQTVRERKAMQRMGGSNLRYFRTDSDWLWSGRLDTQSVQSSATGLARFLITLTSPSVTSFLGCIVVEVEKSPDGITWTHQPPFSSPFGGADWELTNEAVVAAEPYKLKFALALQGPYNEYRRFKVQGLTSSPVAISATRRM